MPRRSPTGRKVYVTNLGPHDYTKAERFGDLIPLTESRVDLYHTDRMMSTVLERLVDFQPNDYILASGNPMVASLIVAEVVSRHGYANILYWDALYQDYIPRRWPTNGGPIDEQA